MNKQTTLIGFLGRPPKKENNEYKKTLYKTSNKDFSLSPTAFLTWELAQNTKPDHLIILGTSGSIWDYLIEVAGDECSGEEIGLIDLVALKNVKQDDLRDIQKAIQKKFQKNTANSAARVTLHIITTAKDESEQIEILKSLNSIVDDLSSITMDITHGFRHLPIIGMASLSYLEITKKCTIKSIFYGEYDPDTEEANLRDLAGLYNILEWSKSIVKFDHSGDYSLFENLLKKEGVSAPSIKSLREGSYFEKLFQLPEARKKLTVVKNELKNPLKGIGELFRESIASRLNWINGNTLSKQQFTLSKEYLARNDYVKSAYYAKEAFISLLCPTEEDAKKHKKREEYEKEFRDGYYAIKQDHSDINDLRNSLVHGTEPRESKIKEILADESKLKSFIGDFIEKAQMWDSSIFHKSTKK